MNLTTQSTENLGAAGRLSKQPEQHCSHFGQRSLAPPSVWLEEPHLLILSGVLQLLLMGARRVVPAAVIEGPRKALERVRMLAQRTAGGGRDAAGGADGAEGPRREYRLRIREAKNCDAAVDAGVRDVTRRGPVVRRGGRHSCATTQECQREHCRAT